MTVVGTCCQMCPEKEVKIRTKFKRLSIFETKAECVKEYARCAAGSVRTPEELRTSTALQMTTDYLVSLLDIKQHEYYTWIETTNFVTDRLRAVRQDIIIQQLSWTVAVPILEKIIRYHIFIQFTLYRESIREHDPVLNDQLLRSYMGDLFEYYDIAKQMTMQKLSCYDEFQSYRILLHMNDPNLVGVRMKITNCESAKLDLTRPKTRFEHAGCLFLNIHVRNYLRFFRSTAKLTFLESCCLLYQISDVRAAFLSVLSHGFCSKQLKCSMETLVDWFHFDNIDHLKGFLDKFKVPHSDNTFVYFREKKQYALNAGQEKYDLVKQCTYVKLIESKMGGCFGALEVVNGNSGVDST